MKGKLVINVGKVVMTFTYITTWIATRMHQKKKTEIEVKFSCHSVNSLLVEQLRQNWSISVLQLIQQAKKEADNE